jgi:hypothetical protein
MYIYFILGNKQGHILFLLGYTRGEYYLCKHVE